MLALVTNEIFCNWLHILYTGEYFVHETIHTLAKFVLQYSKICKTIMYEQETSMHICGFHTNFHPLLNLGHQLLCTKLCEISSMEKCHSKGAFDWSALSALDPGP